MTPALSTPATDSNSEEGNLSASKKRRVLDETSTPGFDSFDGSIVVPEISESFLSDVNWELRKY